MDITFFRSSSYNTYSWCEQQYFLSYCLGLPSPPNLKAELGTITHKVLECLAIAKKCLQDNQNTFKDDAVGEISFTPPELYSDAFVDYLATKAFEYYKNKSEIREQYEAGSYKTIRGWVQAVINHGQFDPRNLNIVAPETQFDFAIEQSWAKLSDGTYLRLKGTIDLIVETAPGLYEICDWKTGKRYDWSAQEEKTYDKLMSDPQLLIYHYAAGRLFPDKQIMLTIYFIRDGGPFTMAYLPECKEKTEQMLRRRFEQIRLVKQPRLTVDWRCNKLCWYGKTPHKCGNGRTICQYISDKTRRLGMDEVVRTETADGFKIGHYECPGA